MFNMSNQFYDYLSKKLVSYFNENPLASGDKYFINFNDNNHVINFYNSLKSFAHAEFRYRCGEEFDYYKTFTILFNDIELIVANSEVQSDFLVTLRNNVSESSGIFENKALLIISDDAKDSIDESVENLEDEGYPFNLDYISNNLNSDIKKSNLSRIDKDILNVYLNENDNNALYKSTLWDFKEVLSIIHKGYIDDEDYRGLDLFKDTAINSISNTTSRKNRLRENKKLYLKIEDWINFDDFDDKVDKLFDNKGVNELKIEDWHNADFKILKQSLDSVNQKNVKLKYEDSFISENLIYWEKSEKDTIAGRRKRHILVFNPDNLNEINFNFNFDKSLNRSFLNKTSKKVCSISKSRLKCKIHPKFGEPTFKNITYKHENLTKNEFKFNICILNCNPEDISSLERFYNIDIRNKSVLINRFDGEIQFGNGNISSVIISENGAEYYVSQEKGINIDISNSISSNDEGVLKFNIFSENCKIPFLIKETDSKTPPIKSSMLWNKKRINKMDFVREGSVLIQGDNGYNIASDKFKEFLDIEEAMIKNRVIHGIYSKKMLSNKNIVLSENIKNIYNELFDYYDSKNNIPSLVYVDDSLKSIYIKLINEFNKEIDLLNDEDILNDYQKDLLNIGLIINNGKLMFSSISPLNIAYQLEVLNQCEDKELNFNLIDNLIPNNLLPYIPGLRNELFCPIHQDIVKEWIIYDNESKVSVGTTNVFIRKVVKEKLFNFVSHFNYLFKTNSKAPLKINVINICDDSEVVKGVFDFVRDRLPDKRKTGNIIPIEVHIYNDSLNTNFDLLFDCKNDEDIKKYFDIDLSDGGIDSLDILRLVQENIKYYSDKMISQNKEYDYAHISFYKLFDNPTISSLNMEKVETGLSLNGLLSTTSNLISSNNNGYQTGFGIKYANINSILVKTAKNLNELSYNNIDDCANPYRKNFAIMSMSKKAQNNILMDLFDKSHWVTFIEPNFGLDYFSTNNDLFVIHYSDQYSSSTKYDTITVTNKSNQYMQIINKFLTNAPIDNFDVSDKDIIEVIRMFNSVNGEWLLHIGLNDSMEREKLSIVSAIKYALSIFNHKDIIWVPISMEEILRVAGNVGLRRSNGLFSVKNLIGKREGKYSDDLLLIGLNIMNCEIYYYPIEVKLGLNNRQVINKAKNQIKGTSNILKSYLLKDDSFMKKFYRNFFIQLFLSNKQKLLNNHIWDEKDYSIVDNFKQYLLNDDYLISRRLKSIIGMGAIISFKKDVSGHLAYLDDDIFIIELPYSDGFKGIVTSIEEINNDIHLDKTDIKSSNLLYGINLNTLEENEILNVVPNESFSDIDATNSVDNVVPKGDFSDIDATNSVDNVVPEENQYNENSSNEDNHNSKENNLNNDKISISSGGIVFKDGQIIGFGHSNTNNKPNLEKDIKLPRDVFRVIIDNYAYDGVTNKYKEAISEKSLSEGETKTFDLNDSKIIIREFISNAGDKLYVHEKVSNGSVIKNVYNEKQIKNLLDELNSKDNQNENEASQVTADNIIDVEKIRVPIGLLANSNTIINWEFGNFNLGNRHILIQGKSGQGKTYFIQKVINELSAQDVPTLIIDYTDGFRQDKLEKEFIDSIGDNFKQHIVVLDKFPLNPFKRYSKDIGGGILLKDDNSDVASRFKSIINSVFNLGEQQLNVIYESVISGLNKYPDDMDFEKLRNEIKKINSSHAFSVLNRLNELFDKNPFKNDDSFDWSILDKRNGAVIAIQLTAIPDNIQKIISEFVLWDLWNYKTQHGSKDKPFLVVLDEAHNLDFGDGSPCGKILQEGRKFGWATLFATQSTQAMKRNEIVKLDNVDEKIFFHPTDSSINSIANLISHNSNDKKEMERKLLCLNKGQCIVYGKIKNQNGELGSSNHYLVNVGPINNN